MTSIVAIQIARLGKLLADGSVTLELDDAALRWLAEAGCDPIYGARPLKRVIQRTLQNPLAERILAGEIGDGATVRVTATPLGLVIHTVPSPGSLEARRSAAE
jgi:ATP-dependent Clp protease ATP-binding subunit ClpB